MERGAFGEIAPNPAGLRQSLFEQLVVRAASEAVISESKGAALLNEPLMDFRERLLGVA